ncbi:MAG: hypothetical protein N3B17_06105 [Chlorobi bacterium]|nr:hypothetical protein [Chlorobiota bacterium]
MPEAREYFIVAISVSTVLILALCAAVAFIRSSAGHWEFRTATAGAAVAALVVGYWLLLYKALPLGWGRNSGRRSNVANGIASAAGIVVPAWLLASVPLRIGAPPEVTVITLRKSNATR